MIDIHDGQEFRAKIMPESDKSGAAMRAAPLGLLSDITEIKTKCQIQAAVTHNTPDGIAAAQVASLMVHYCFYKLGAISEIGVWLNSVVKSSHNWDENYVGKVKAQGWMSVRAAITALKRHTKLSDLLMDCINFKGDVDTVATIALAAASVSDVYQQDLPQNLIDTLENNTYGRDYLIQLDKKLLEAVVS